MVSENTVKSVECTEVKKTKTMNRWLLVAPLLYFVALGILALLFHDVKSVNLMGLQSVPLAVLWFGALGGVVASLQGIFLHNQKWDDSYDYWHLFSGLIGAAYGLASYLFLLVIVNSTQGTSQAAPQGVAVYILGAFAIGYGQSQFHAMMDRVYTVIFHPSKVAPEVSKDTVDVNLQIKDAKATLDVQGNQPK